MNSIFGHQKMSNQFIEYIILFDMDNYNQNFNSIFVYRNILQIT